MATLSAIQSSLIPRSLSPPLSAPSDVIVTKTGSQLRQQRARDEKSILWKGLGETSRWLIPSATLLSKSIGSNSDVLTSAAAFEKGLRQYHELMQRIQCCSYALINIARIVRDEYCLFGLWLRCSRWWNQTYQWWLTVHAVSGTRACIKSTLNLTTAKRRWPIIKIDL